MNSEPHPEGGRARDGYKGAGDKREGYKGKNKGKPGQGREADKPSKVFEARAPRYEKPIDPDNPFAVLAALKAKL